MSKRLLPSRHAGRRLLDDPGLPAPDGAGAETWPPLQVAAALGESGQARPIAPRLARTLS
jgi:hypothetical protein